VFVGWLSLTLSTRLPGVSTINASKNFIGVITNCGLVAFVAAALVLGVPNLANLGSSFMVQSIAIIWCCLVTVLLLVGLPYYLLGRRQSRLIFDSVFNLKPVDLQLYISADNTKAKDDRRAYLNELRSQTKSRIPQVMARLQRVREEYRDKLAASEALKVQSYLIQRVLSKESHVRELAELIGLGVSSGDNTLSVVEGAGPEHESHTRAVTNIRSEKGEKSAIHSRSDVPVVLHEHDSIMISDVDG